jgi:2-dehydropantoate 2-reductase
VRYAVYGAGAIGAYVGACLARGGAEVVLIARGAHLEAMRQKGVLVHSPRGDFRAHPPATDDVAALRDADVVFLGVKAYSLPAVAPTLAEQLRPGARVIAAQNGVPWWFLQQPGVPLHGTVLESVDPGGRIAAALPVERVIGCVVYCSTEIAAPGVIRHTEGTRFPLTLPGSADQSPLEPISAAFRAGGLKAPIERSLREQLWLKLIGNVAFNPVSALTGATLGELGTVAELRAVLRAMMVECGEVGRRLGIELPVSIDRRLQAGLEVGDHKPSMLQDLEAGKPLELDCLTGAMIELAAMLDVPVPHAAAIHACVVLRDRLRHDA